MDLSTTWLEGLKTGTEVEDMNEAEIALFAEIAYKNQLSLTIKIGGPEARNDMRICERMGVDIVLAPMVETVYALSNFVESAKGILSQAKLAINLESMTAIQNFDEMLQSEAMKEIAHVTIGRGDLSKSLDLDVCDSRISEITKEAIQKIAKTGKTSSVGGGWNISKVSYFESDWINTRHMLIRPNREQLKNQIQDVLELEEKLYSVLAGQFPERSQFYEKRIQVIRSRRIKVPSELES